MPFQSQAQKGFLFANHPEVAKEFADKTPPGKKLPPHKKKKHNYSKAQQDAIQRRLKGGKGSGRN